MHGIALSLATSARVVHVIVRNIVNTKLANAGVVVLPGKVPSMSFLAMKRQFRAGSLRLARELEGEHAPNQVVAAARPLTGRARRNASDTGRPLLRAAETEARAMKPQTMQAR